MKEKMKNEKKFLKIISCMAIFYMMLCKITYAISVNYAVELNFIDDLWKMIITLIIIFMISLAYIIAIIIEKEGLLHSLKNFSVVINIVMLIYFLVIEIKYNMFFSTSKYYVPICISLAVLSISVLIQLLNIKCNTIKRKKIIICFSIIGIISICGVFTFRLLELKNILEEHRNNKPATGLDVDIEKYLEIKSNN